MTYEDVYSQFYLLMTDPSFYKLSQNQVYDMMRGWLHNAIATPYIRKVFSEITLDDELMTITYKLCNSADDNSDNDNDFVINILAQYMVIAWMQPQIDSVINLAVVLGTKEEKKIQSNYKASIDRLDALKTALRKTIRDYGYINNDYVSEEL